MTKTVAALPHVTDAQAQAINAAPRTPESHRALLADVEAMSLLETGGVGTRDKLPGSIGVATWNVERCLFPKDSAAHLAPHGLDVVLLSEMDSGMARTGQRNTTAAMAEAMGMHYVYGVEFFELGLGGPTELHFCKDDFNEAGWHGNGVLSSAPFQDLRLIRLDMDGHWFCTGPNSAADPEQPRLGGRMAIAAIIDTESGPACFVSTHLESNTNAVLRHQQFRQIMEEVEEFAPGLPVLIGGDLNTGNHMPPDFDWRAETLFGYAETRGYNWSLTAEGATTRPSLITPHPTRKFKLDWFCARGMTGTARPILSSLDRDGRPLSDHDCMLCTVEIT